MLGIPLGAGGTEVNPEWSRNSCSPPLVILEETAEPLATLDG